MVIGFLLTLTIYIYGENLFDPCFAGKRPYFSWFKAKKRGQNSSRHINKYIYIYMIEGPLGIISSISLFCYDLKIKRYE